MVHLTFGRAFLIFRKPHMTFRNVFKTFRNEIKSSCRAIQSFGKGFVILILAKPNMVCAGKTFKCRRPILKNVIYPPINHPPVAAVAGPAAGAVPADGAAACSTKGG